MLFRSRLRLEHPILSNQELEKIRSINIKGYKSKTIDITYKKGLGKEGLTKALDKICKESLKAIDKGYSFIILSDKNITSDKLALSTLLACSTVHNFLVKKEKRTQIGIVLETSSDAYIDSLLIYWIGSPHEDPLWHRLQSGIKKLEEYAQLDN